jgi:hypothetical protein
MAMLTAEQLAYAYQRIRIEAERLAGRNGDLAQRATVYHHLYHHSRGNHVFPLIAAHGALWAKGYFAFGRRLGWALSWLTPFSAEARRQKLQLLDEFADAFRNVNRLVCIETYTTYHFTMRFGDHPQATDLIPRPLLEQLLCVHQASSSDVPLSAPAKRAVFEAFFLNEQETVVGPKINAANESFDWPLMRTIALMPHVKFAYMPGLGLQFRNFCDQSQRIKNGMRACDIALAVGLDVVERALEHYQILGDNFVETSEARFEQVRGV